jgi:putative flippase GtrA
MPLLDFNNKLDFQITLKQSINFLLIGLVTVLVDYSTYRSLIFFEYNISIAKSIGFALGTIFSFIANRNITFNVKNNFFGHLIKFSMLYFTSMMFNLFVNSISLGLFKNSNLKVQISFILATITSATINFVGMKYFVFK